MRELKDTPRAAVVMVKRDQLAAFRDTTGKSIGIIRKLYFVLATIVAFGVVYNSARIALSERSRELATLRVVGFSLRGSARRAGRRAGDAGSVSAARRACFSAAAWRCSSCPPSAPKPCACPSSSTTPPTPSPSSWCSPPPCCSFALVSRMIGKLDMVGVLKARD